MRPDIAQALANDWGTAGCEALAQRTQAGTAEGREFRARLQAMPPAEAADAIRPLFAVDPTAEIADALVDDLGLAAEAAKLIADEIAATRRRLAHATRPVRRRREPAAIEAG